jgi:hypothetical protein
MDFGEIMRVIRKRWYVALPGAILTVALTLVAYLAVPMKYESLSTLALINSPRSVTAPGNGNPFLTFESSLTATADFLARSLTADETVDELKGMGVTEEYTAALADNAQGPFITLTVTGTDKVHVLESTKVLTEYAKRKLRTMQEQSGAPENSMIQAATIIPPQPPEPVLKKKVEVVAGAAGGAIAVSFLAVVLVESIARTRQRGQRMAALDDRTRVQPQNEQTAEMFFPHAGQGSGRRAPRLTKTREPSTSSSSSSGGSGSSGTGSGSNLTTVYRSSAVERRRADADSPVES